MYLNIFIKIYWEKVKGRHEIRFILKLSRTVTVRDMFPIYFVPHYMYLTFSHCENSATHTHRKMTRIYPSRIEYLSMYFLS